MSYQHFAIDRSASALSGLFLFLGVGLAWLLGRLFALPVWAMLLIVIGCCLLSVPVQIAAAKRRQKKAGIDPEVVLHRRAVVTEEVYNRTNEGAVELDGKTYPVRMAGDSVVAVGTEVEIVDVAGHRLVILPVKKEN